MCPAVCVSRPVLPVLISHPVCGQDRSGHPGSTESITATGGSHQEGQIVTFIFLIASIEMIDELPATALEVGIALAARTKSNCPLGWSFKGREFAAIVGFLVCRVGEKCF